MAGKFDKEAKAIKALSAGGARIARSGIEGEVFSRHGNKLERESGAGMVTQVNAILDPRLALSERQRATGNCYGAFCEQVTIAGSAPFMREYVDRSHTGTGGASERQVQMIGMVRIARATMAEHPPVVYRLGQSRGDGAVGPHRNIRAIILLDAVCINGLTLEKIAGVYGWTVERKGGAKAGEVVVPDRQRKHLAEALRGVLDAVYDAWDSKGWGLPYEFLQVVVR